MNLQEFEKLLSAHLPPKRVRKIIRIYLDVVGEEIDSDYELNHEIPEGMTYDEYCRMKDSLNT